LQQRTLDVEKQLRKSSYDPGALVAALSKLPVDKPSKGDLKLLQLILSKLASKSSKLSTK
jgi:hypothetical protein